MKMNVIVPDDYPTIKQALASVPINEYAEIFVKGVIGSDGKPEHIEHSINMRPRLRVYSDRNNLTTIKRSANLYGNSNRNVFQTEPGVSCEDVILEDFKIDGMYPNQPNTGGMGIHFSPNLSDPHKRITIRRVTSINSRMGFTGRNLIGTSWEDFGCIVEDCISEDCHTGITFINSDYVKALRNKISRTSGDAIFPQDTSSYLPAGRDGTCHHWIANDNELTDIGDTAFDPTIQDGGAYPHTDMVFRNNKVVNGHIRVSGSEDVWIEDNEFHYGTGSKSHIGVDTGAGQNARIHINNNKITAIRAAGIKVFVATDGEIKNNTIIFDQPYADQAGIVPGFKGTSVIENNVIENSVDGMAFHGWGLGGDVDSLIIRDNTIKNFSRYGIWDSNRNQNRVTITKNKICSEIGDWGVYTQVSSGSAWTIRENEITAESKEGNSAVNASRSTVENNVACGTIPPEPPTNGWLEGVHWLQLGDIAISDDEHPESDHLRNGVNIIRTANGIRMDLKPHAGFSRHHRNYLNIYLKDVIGERITVRLEDIGQTDPNRAQTKTAFFDDSPYMGRIMDDLGLPRGAIHMVATYDGVNWFRITDWDKNYTASLSGGRVGWFEFTHTFTQNTVQIATQFPAKLGYIRAFEQEIEPHPFVIIEDLGATQQGNRVHMVNITDGQNEPQKRHVAIMTQQHPSETISTIIAEHMIREILVDPEYTNNIHWYFILGLNVDGILLGMPRGTSVPGMDPNDEWNSNDCPCVNVVRSRLQQVESQYGLDVFMDWHSLGGHEVTGHFMSTGTSIAPYPYDPPYNYPEGGIRWGVVDRTPDHLFYKPRDAQTRHSSGGWRLGADAGGTIEFPMRSPVTTLAELEELGVIWAQEIYREFGGGIPPQPPNQPPTAEANGPYSGKVGELIQFSSQGSQDPDGTITLYLWNFGDGSVVSAASNPTHAYESAGTYTVNLTVTDNEGLTDSDSTVCVIEDEPEPPVDYVTRAELDAILESYYTKDEVDNIIALIKAEITLLKQRLDQVDTWINSY